MNGSCFTRLVPPSLGAFHRFPVRSRDLTIIRESRDATAPAFPARVSLSD